MAKPAGLGIAVLSVMLMLAPALAQNALKEDGAAEAGKAVDLTGTLETGIMAIGGETTGVQLTVGDEVYELALRGKMGQKAEDLNGKTVHVTGTLRIRNGVERKGIKTITVTLLEEKNAPATKPAETRPAETKPAPKR